MSKRCHGGSSVIDTVDAQQMVSLAKTHAEQHITEIWNMLYNSSNTFIPQVYALVGVAAMLAANCRVPLTSVLLLFELTRGTQLSGALAGCCAGILPAVCP